MGDGNKIMMGKGWRKRKYTDGKRSGRRKKDTDGKGLGRFKEDNDGKGMGIMIMMK